MAEELPEKVNCPECGMFVLLRMEASGPKISIVDIVTKCPRGLDALSCPSFRPEILIARYRSRFTQKG